MTISKISFFFLCLISLQSFSQDLEWSIITAGTDNAAGIKEDGSLWTWGWNGYGQLGFDGENTNFPAQVGTDLNWVAVSSGAYHTLALKSDGSLWSWGENFNGGLGDGTTTQRTTPTQIGEDTDWSVVSAGFSSSFAIKQDGTLWTWGWNGFGQLGQGNTTQLNVPTQAGTDTDWQDVNAGGRHVLVLKSDGTLWGSGLNFSGQLGQGNFESPITNFVQVGSDTDWVEMSAGFGHSIALKENGTIWTWGFNGSGQLGNGSTAQSADPIQIGENQTWVKVNAGSTFIYAISADSTLFGAGFNGGGQLGLGNTETSVPDFQLLDEVTNWVDIQGAAGLLFDNSIFGAYGLGLRSERTSICAAGDNFIGQHGNGTNENSLLWACSQDINLSDELSAVAEKDGIIVYPNPNNGEFKIRINTINGKNPDFEIYNSHGKLIFESESHDSNSLVDLTAFPAGIYVVRYQEGSIRLQEKVVVN